jgi:CRP/FNR family cyclic AMP-dependent transcriptional regulator
MSDLIERFEGPDSRERLLTAIKKQALIQGDELLAAAFADEGSLSEFAAGDTLMTQDDWDSDLYLILAGEFDVIINGKRQSTRGAGVHVGEQTGANASRPRSATLKARGPSVVLKLTANTIDDLTKDNPEYWRRATAVIAERLEERNRKIGQTNDVPRVFVISSSEAQAVVDEIILNLESNEIAVQPWTQGTFGVSEYPISSLMDAIEACDFTIAVVSADDTLISRKQENKVARDNVHLEYGISLGLLGRRRSMLLVSAEPTLKLPSDLAGLTTYRYQAANTDKLKRSVRKACVQAREHILSEGVFEDRRAS